MSTTMRPLVITTAFSYGPNELWPLAKSLQEHAPTAELLVLTAPADMNRLSPLQDAFDSIAIEAVSNPPKIIRGHLAVPRKLGASAKKWLRRRQQQLSPLSDIAVEGPRHLGLSTIHTHFLIRRFFWAQEQLKRSRWQGYDSIMLCDIRDVAIQANPFPGIGDSLITGAELNTIGQCPINRGWIKKAYGHSIEQSLHNQPILCAGVTIGSRQQIVAYLDLFCQESLALIRQHRTSHLSNLDQAIHNKILRTESSLNLSISPVNGLIATVGCLSADQCVIPTGQGPVTVMGSTPAVIHQYDRLAALTDHIQSRYGHQCVHTDPEA
jgi:hypothetical protein